MVLDTSAFQEELAQCLLHCHQDFVGRIDGGEAVASEEVLRKGFGGKGREYEERATEVQLAFERWVLRKKEHAEGARKAFLSHMRAYATHPSDEKHIFHIRHLHIGHLAKAFALREAPSAVGSAGNKVGAKSKSKMPGSRRVKDAATGKAKKSASGKIRGLGYDVSEGHDGDAERRMQAAVRAQGKTSKKGGVMMSSGTAEFQVASTDALERLVNRT
ncbi:hypothetical protein EWM64_g469 [Hericium alpestre]|uniref:ATP-dependent rRNA helicase SPB4-like C-terminal extension domain-containing protein n=1 Tax=Hericium alpestre TaxID=135208 RepID=A0A4Z0ABY8_9AGAM|nr:hypothetical protein EWM64_g469 [Hericium alpestre]